MAEELSQRDPALDMAIAARNGDLQYLKDKRDLFMTLDWRGDSILSHAVDENTPMSYQSMVYMATTPLFKPMLHIQSQVGNYPLFYAALRPDKRFLIFLLKAGARILPPGSVDGTAKSLLHILIGDRHRMGSLRILLKDLFMMNTEKYTQSERIGLLSFESRMIGLNGKGDTPRSAVELAAAMRIDLDLIASS